MQFTKIGPTLGFASGGWKIFQNNIFPNGWYINPMVESLKQKITLNEQKWMEQFYHNEREPEKEIRFGNPDFGSLLNFRAVT